MLKKQADFKEWLPANVGKKFVSGVVLQLMVERAVQLWEMLTLNVGLMKVETSNTVPNVEFGPKKYLGATTWNAHVAILIGVGCAEVAIMTDTMKIGIFLAVLEVNLMQKVDAFYFL
jgi:hypothetical protein